MITLIVLTILCIIGIVLSISLGNEYGHISPILCIVSGFGLILCIAASLASPMQDSMVKTFSTSQLTIETTPYRVVITAPLDPYKEFLWKDAYTVSRAKDITGLRVTTPVNAWGITLDSQTKVELLFSDSTAHEATAR